MKRISQKLKNFINRRKQKKVNKRSDNKRKILASGTLVARLVFGGLKVNSVKTENYQFNNSGSSKSTPKSRIQ